MLEIHKRHEKQSKSNKIIIKALTNVGQMVSEANTWALQM